MRFLPKPSRKNQPKARGNRKKEQNRSFAPLSVLELGTDGLVVVSVGTGGALQSNAVASHFVDGVMDGISSVF